MPVIRVQCISPDAGDINRFVGYMSRQACIVLSIDRKAFKHSYNISDDTQYDDDGICAGFFSACSMKQHGIILFLYIEYITALEV